MKKNMQAVIGAMILIFTSCTLSSQIKGGDNAATSEKARELRIVNWNVQTFFDAVNDGTEYSQYKSGKSNWGRDTYIVRLERLCEVVRKLDADVYVFEEIENESIMYDIANALASGAWSSKNWNYACFTKIPGDALGCAVLSRYELGTMTTHALDIRTHGKQPSMRPIISVSMFIGKKPLTIFVNHWKSKLGGEAETEIWRNWQESVLAGIIAHLNGSASIACGDFNRDISEFARGAENDVVLLRGARFGNVHHVEAHSPWLWKSNGIPNMYSYYYQGNGERIDHFFASGDIAISAFAAETDGNWTDNGIPSAYAIVTGKGYSDHLPISAIIVY